MNKLMKVLQMIGELGGVAGRAAPKFDDAAEAALKAMRGNVSGNIDDITRNLIKNEGFTFDPMTGRYVVPRAADPTSTARGYAVSVNPREQEILLGSPGKVDPADLMDAYDQLVASGTMRPGVNFGGFFSKDAQRYAMDPAELILDRRGAMRAARRRGQEAVFDVSAPDWESANIRTSDLRREFRRKDTRTAAALAALAALLGGSDAVRQ